MKICLCESMIKTVELKCFYSLTQLNYFFMIHLVIFSSTIMYKSTYVFVRIEVLAKTKVRCLR